MARCINTAAVIQTTYSVVVVNNELAAEREKPVNDPNPFVLPPLRSITALCLRVRGSSLRRRKIVLKFFTILKATAALGLVATLLLGSYIVIHMHPSIRGELCTFDDIHGLVRGARVFYHGFRIESTWPEQCPSFLWHDRDIQLWKVSTPA